MFLLPVMLKQARLLLNREQAAGVARNDAHAALKAVRAVFGDLKRVVLSDGKTWGICRDGC